MFLIIKYWRISSFFLFTYILYDFYTLLRALLSYRCRLFYFQDHLQNYCGISSYLEVRCHSWKPCAVHFGHFNRGVVQSLRYVRPYRLQSPAMRAPWSIELHEPQPLIADVNEFVTQLQYPWWKNPRQSCTSTSIEQFIINSTTTINANKFSRSIITYLLKTRNTIEVKNSLWICCPSEFNWPNEFYSITLYTQTYHSNKYSITLSELN